MFVRKARAGDAPAVETLYQELLPQDRNIRVDPARLQQLEADPNNHLLVVEEDGGICGAVFYTFCQDAMYGFLPFGIVEHVIVAEAARGRGAGRALMTAVEERARAAHCTRLVLLSAAHRVEAHAFFERMGYEGDKKRGFVNYINRKPAIRAGSS